eukprot:1768823-Rhodomonas_salina.2
MYSCRACGEQVLCAVMFFVVIYAAIIESQGTKRLRLLSTYQVVPAICRRERHATTGPSTARGVPRAYSSSTIRSPTSTQPKVCIPPDDDAISCLLR